MHPAMRAVVLEPGLARPDLDLDPRPENLWQDSAGTTPVAADGDPVGLWRDRYGGTTWSQSTAGRRPLYKTGILNGYPVIRGDGTDDFLSGGTNALNLARATAGFTMLAVVKYGKAATEQVAQWVINAGTSSRALLSTDATNFRLTAGGRNTDGGSFVGASDSNNKSTSVFYVQTGILNFAGGPVRVRVNGTQYGSSSFASPAATPNTASDSAALFAFVDGTNPLKGDIARLLCWRRVLRPDEIRRWERHLGRLYNIAVAG